MKKVLMVFLCACLLLSGCGSGPAPAETVQPSPLLPLLEQGAPLAEGSALRYIPNEAVETMTAPEMCLFGNGLLLSEHKKDCTVLKLISLEDGSTVKECSVPACPGTTLTIGNGQIGLCDREAGLITVLDDTLQLQRTYEVPREGDSWHLPPELDRLYVFFYDRGLLVRDLETGTSCWMVDNGSQVTPVGSGGGYVLFAYTDRADQKTCTRCLNLSTATMETLPVSGPVSEGTRQGETWLLRGSGPEGDHLLVRDGTIVSFAHEGGPVRLLSPKRHLLINDPARKSMALYETDGSFLSRCALPQSSQAVLGQDLVWSGYWEGYFLTEQSGDHCRLLFWDVSAGAEGEDLRFSAPEQALAPQTVPEQQLYDRAKELSQRFGVDIRIAGQCALDYDSYGSQALTEPIYIRTALDTLEKSLGMYPEDFFRQLTIGSAQSVRIELVGGITAKEDTGTLPPSAGGFTHNMGSYYLMVLDGYLLQPETVFHEFSHIIDARLEWDSFEREDALYSEAMWLSLQPPGAHYAMSYDTVPEDVLGLLESGYFISEYSLTYPSEDRAELMAAAMSGALRDMEPESGLGRKLQYYSACIRDCFDTEGWPESTLWEQALR